MLNTPLKAGTTLGTTALSWSFSIRANNSRELVLARLLATVLLICSEQKNSSRQSLRAGLDVLAILTHIHGTSLSLCDFDFAPSDQAEMSGRFVRASKYRMLPHLTCPSHALFE